MRNLPRDWKQVGLAGVGFALVVLQVIGLSGAFRSSMALPFTPYGGADGETCVQPSECASGFCEQGVCCHTACDGLKSACNQPGLEGTCTRREVAPALSWHLQLVVIGLLLALAWRSLSRRSHDRA